MNTKSEFDLLSIYRNAIMGFAALWIYCYHEHLLIFNDFKGINLIEQFIKRLGFCGVDIFLFLSGIGLTYSIQKTTNIFSFYYRRIKRIILPFLAVAVLRFYLEGWTITKFLRNISGINFFTKKIYSFLWFVPTIMIFYLFFPLYYKLFKKASDKIQFTLCALNIWLILSLCVRLVMRSDLFVFTNRIPIFIIGILAGWIAQNNKFVFKRITWCLLALMLALGLYLNYLVIYKDMYILVPSSSCAIPNILISIPICFLLSKFFYLINEKPRVKIIGKGLVKIFSFFGMFSLEFYCIQEWAGSKVFLRMLGKYSNLTIDITLFALVTVTALIFSYFTKYFWIFTERITQKVFITLKNKKFRL